MFTEFLEICKELTLIAYELEETARLLALMFLLLVLMTFEFELIAEMFLEMVAITDVSWVAPPGRLPIATD